MRDNSHLVWVDMEMTGLDPDHDRVIEIASIVTDSNLNVLAEGPVIAIHQSDAVLAGMDEWNTSHHTRSGLVDRVRASKSDEAIAARETLGFLASWTCERASPMCGNSICQDRRFLARQMPLLEAFFHYRNLDVSSVKEIIRRWRPELMKGFNKQSSHLAMADIKDSIAELTYYRDVFFIMEPQAE